VSPLLSVTRVLLRRCLKWLSSVAKRGEAG